MKQRRPELIIGPGVRQHARDTAFLDPYRSLAVAKSFCECSKDHLLMLLFYYAWRCREDPECRFSLTCLWRLTRLEQCAQQFSPVLIASVWSQDIAIHVLPCNFRYRIANFVPHAAVAFGSEALEKFRAYRVSLWFLEGEEEFLALTVGILRGTCRDAPKQDCCEGSRLREGISVCRGCTQRIRSYLTAMSCDPRNCSTSPMSNTSGRA